MRLPRLLEDSEHRVAVEALRRYYLQPPYDGLGPFTGARFDSWDSSGTRENDWDRFTADDLVAVSLLSVDVPPAAAIRLLDTDGAKFTGLLRKLGDDRDLVEEIHPWEDGWAGWQVWSALTDLPNVGPTTASKLFARKRPRLRPIYDSVVAGVIGSNKIWEPLRELLSEQPGLHSHMLALRDEAELPEAISALRVFDVVAWMQGKYGPEAVWSEV